MGKFCFLMNFASLDIWMSIDAIFFTLRSIKIIEKHQNSNIPMLDQTQVMWSG